MSIINRVPKGWLGILDAKTQGQTPKDPLTQLTPSMDLTPNYLADIPLQIGFNQTSAAVLAFTFVAPVEVPAGELWYVYACGCEFVNAGAGYSNGVIAVSGPVDGGVTVCPLFTNQSWDAAPQGGNWTTLLGITYPTPLLLSSGSVLGILVGQQVGTGASNGRTKVAYRSVKV